MASKPVTPKRGWESTFLATFRQMGNVRASCEAAGISRKTAYLYRCDSAAFAAEWDEAAEDACDRLEKAAWERAQQTSDVLLIFLLKSLRPDRYREPPKVVIRFGDLKDDDLDAYIASGELALAKNGKGGTNGAAARDAEPSSSV